MDYFNWKKADSKDFVFYASILWPSRKSQMVVKGYTSVVAWRQEVGVGAKGTLWNDENILYVDCGGSYKIVYFCQNSSHCPLKTGDFFVCMLDSSKSDFTIVVLVTMFPCCCPEDQVSECWRGWVRASVGIVQKGQQPGQQELWQLYGRHPVPPAPMGRCHISFYWSPHQYPGSHTWLHR